MRPFIYALVDPLEPDHYRYIGMSMGNRNRPLQHGEIVKRRTGSLRRSQLWIRSLQNENRKYQVIVLEYLPEVLTRKQIVAAEHEAMRRAISLGHQLTNYNQDWFETQVKIHYTITDFTISLQKPITLESRKPHPVCGFITKWGIPCTNKVPTDGRRCRHHIQPKKLTTKAYVGMKIQHHKFGAGVITSVDPYQHNPIAIVLFEKVGHKKLRIISQK